MSTLTNKESKLYSGRIMSTLTNKPHYILMNQYAHLKIIIVINAFCIPTGIGETQEWGSLES